MSEPTVAAGFVKGLLAFAVQQGGDRAALLAASGVDERDLANHDTRIPLACYMALMRAGQVACDDPALALHFGESVGAQDLSVVCMIGATLPTMGDAFRHMNRYARLVIDVEAVDGGDHFPLRQVREGAWLLDARPFLDRFPELTEASFARFVSGARTLSDRPFVRAVQMRHPAPAYAAEYERIFAAPVTFGSDRNGMLVDPAWFSQPINVQPRYVGEILTAHADELLAALEAGRSCRGRVEAALAARLADGDVGVDAIARSLNMSRQTLYRRLKAEGVTFAEVLDGLRRRKAMEYVHEQKLSVSRSAQLVGFTDPAAFSRAFKRWTGASPRQTTRIALAS